MLCDETLIELESLMEEDFPDFLNAFFVDTEKRLATLSALHMAKDLQSLRKAAHSFKGSLANLGALDMVNYCEHIRQSTIPHDISKNLDQLHAGWPMVRAELTRRYLN